MTEQVTPPEAETARPIKKGGKGGADPEWMREITRRRLELAKTDPSRGGGRPRTRVTRAEAEARALEEMLPKALKVLKTQLDSPDERIQQSAAVKVLEYVKGKPTQNINQNVQQVSEIRYESAAWQPGQHQPEVIEGDWQPLELPPSSDDPDT